MCLRWGFALDFDGRVYGSPSGSLPGLRGGREGRGRRGKEGKRRREVKRLKGGEGKDK